MSVIIDTPIWSLALRRGGRVSTKEQALIDELRALIAKTGAVMLGPIRQELLSGVRDRNQFGWLCGVLDDFSNTLIHDEDYVGAARYSNLLRSVGIQCTPVDILVCAVAIRLGAPIFTTDMDFTRYAQHLPLKLHQAEE